MLCINIAPNVPVRLESCTGERSREGEYVRCGSGCQAHFDANHESESFEFDNAYPNSILSWVSLLPGSSAADELIPADQTTGARPDWIKIHRNDDIFLDSNGLPVPVWVVSLNAAEPNFHFAALFINRAKAAGLAAAVTTEDH